MPPAGTREAETHGIPQTGPRRVPGPVHVCRELARTRETRPRRVRACRLGAHVYRRRTTKHPQRAAQQRAIRPAPGSFRLMSSGSDQSQKRQGARESHGPTGALFTALPRRRTAVPATAPAAAPRRQRRPRPRAARRAHAAGYSSAPFRTESRSSPHARLREYGVSSSGSLQRSSPSSWWYAFCTAGAVPMVAISPMPLPP